MRARRLLPVILALLPAACGGKQGAAGLPTTLCEPAAMTCLGNYKATCADDGRSFLRLETCSPDGACVDGACEPRKCTPAGADRCETTDVVLLCSEDGRVATRLPCPKLQSCYGGACLPDECDPAKDLPTCTFETLVTCEGGRRKAQPCPSRHACAGTECIPRLDCDPGEARCSGETISGVCNANATDWEVTVCKPSEHCVAAYGFCVPRLADLPEPEEVVEDVPLDLPGDAVSDTQADSDAGDVPSTDIPFIAPNRATINGKEVAFDYLPTVSVTPESEEIEAQVSILLLSGNRLDVPLPSFPDEGTTLSIEIALIDVKVDDFPGLVGTYACGGTEGPRARLWLRYGLHSTGSVGACRNYDFGAGVCTVTVTDGGTADARILKGTFEAPGMVECLAGTQQSVTLAAGAFEAEP